MVREMRLSTHGKPENQKDEQWGMMKEKKKTPRDD